MSYRLSRLNRAIKDYDKDLYVIRSPNGMDQVWRKSLPKDLFGLTEASHSSKPNVNFILALTDDLKLTGNPVEWGIEPIIATLKSWDNWRDDTQFEKMKKRREFNEESEKNSQKHEFRARAADMRKDFARATNEINTSSLKGDK